MTRTAPDRDEVTRGTLWTEGPRRRTDDREPRKRNAWQRTMRVAADRDDADDYNPGIRNRIFIAAAAVTARALAFGAALAFGLTWATDSLVIGAIVVGAATTAVVLSRVYRRGMGTAIVAAVAGLTAAAAFGLTVSKDLLLVLLVGAATAAAAAGLAHHVNRRRAQKHASAVYMGDAADDGDRTAPTYQSGSVSRFQRLSTIALATTLTTVVVGVGYLAYSNHQLQDALSTSVNDAANFRPASPLPSGPAEMCTAMAIESGATDEAVNRLNAACGIGIDPRTLGAQASNGAQLRAVTALDRPLSYETDQPGVYSMLVAAQLVTWTPDDTGTTGTYTDQGVHYYRTSTSVADSGKYAMLTLPREVAVPVNAAPVRPKIDLSTAAMSDPRTSVIAEYLSRFYLAPPADNQQAGSVANFTESGSANLTLHSPDIQEVTVIQTAYSDPDPDGYTSAFALAQLTYQGGAVVTQMIPLSITNNTGRWLISDRTPAVTYEN